MKKYMLTIGLALAGATAANAQKVMGGPELGVNLTNMAYRSNGNKMSTDMMAGLKVGAVLDIGVTPSFSIQPGLFYSMKGFQNDYTQSVTIAGVRYNESVDMRMRVNYLEVPINFLYKAHWTNGTVFLGGGPYVAAAIGGEVEVERVRTFANGNDGRTITETWTDDLEVGTDAPRDHITPMDAGLNFTGGYEFNNGLYLRANIGLGLANVMPDGNDDNYMRNYGVGFSVGYMFGK